MYMHIHAYTAQMHAHMYVHKPLRTYMHAYVSKRTQAYMGGAQGPGQGDKSEGYPGRGGGPRILTPGTYTYIYISEVGGSEFAFRQAPP